MECICGPAGVEEACPFHSPRFNTKDRSVKIEHPLEEEKWANYRESMNQLKTIEKRLDDIEKEKQDLQIKHTEAIAKAARSKAALLTVLGAEPVVRAPGRMPGDD